MSLFTDARLRMALTPQQSLLVKTRGWWHPRAVAEAHCGSALDDIGRLLEQQTWKGLSTEVTLCDSWARYFIVEPVQGLRSLSELRQYTSICFAETHGQLAAEWQIEADWQTGAPMLAVALPKGLLHDMKDVLSKAGNPLLAIEPFFVNTYNQCCRQIKHRSAWLLAMGPQHATLGLVVNGHWRGIRSTSIDTSAPLIAVEQLVQRCRLQFELEQDVPMVILPAQRAQISTATEPHSMHGLALSRCRT